MPRKYASPTSQAPATRAYRTARSGLGQPPETRPEAVVAPGLLIAGTDVKHYVPLTAAVYRFRPFRITPADVARIHGTDERIAVAGFADLIVFYADVLQRLAP